MKASDTRLPPTTLPHCHYPHSFLVFFMQVGFLALETGSGRAKNVRNILLKNLLDVMLAAMVWWAVGYAFAYGKSAKGIIG
jgi:Amt family ammonium transporter